MEIYGNASTYNLENVLRANITGCDYYRNDCAALPNWQAVVDEIYGAVDHVEPWLGGNARGPSSAFCLLHRLFALKMSLEEITATINHADSPYIRAVGGGSTWGLEARRRRAGAAAAGGDPRAGPAAGDCCVAAPPHPPATLPTPHPPSHPPPTPTPPPRSASSTCATRATPATCGTGSRDTWRTRRCAGGGGLGGRVWGPATQRGMRRSCPPQHAPLPPPPHSTPADPPRRPTPQPPGVQALQAARARYDGRLCARPAAGAGGGPRGWG
jgi:hypothetical protein